MEQIFKIGSVSMAAAARRALSNRSIKGRLTKTDGGEEGCAWGIAVEGREAVRAAKVFKESGIRYEAL